MALTIPFLDDRPIAFRTQAADRVSRDAFREVNERIYRNLLRLLDGLNRAELCRKAGVPESTLSSQMAKRRFTFELLAPLSRALGVSIGELADPPAGEIPDGRAPEVIQEIERLLERARR